ncbi:hypothetical protein [Streptomyces sp. NPDC047525]|uniref:MmyB family transcriptional regulator n=1 Tax=Streptomyces sp. NPDC047525 TaxID=3155264 RepID=UPI00340DEC11
MRPPYDHPRRPACREFVAGWRDHDVRPVPMLRKHLRHPEPGDLEVVCQTLLLPGTGLQLAMTLVCRSSNSLCRLC